MTDFEKHLMHVELDVRQVRILNRLGWARYSRIADSKNGALRAEAKALLTFLGETDRKLGAHDYMHDQKG
jgi:hypothetical protein